MKILKIHIKNLNSLKGSFEIDFEASPLHNTGLFLISGPTGAGKTTILDAITLALYGEAPRFDDSKGKSSYEMMTHGTNECMAELQFETAAGKFMVSWKVKKSSGSGRIQPPKRELVQLFDDERPNKVIASKIREVNHYVEELLGGLNFNRFKRSIMLAQGDFAQFLKGTEDRSDILERITDTALYSEISKHAHLRHKLEMETLEKLKQQTEHLELMEEEELAALKADILKMQDVAKIKAAEIKQHQKGLDWHQQKQKLQQQLNEHQQIQKRLKDEQAAHLKDFEQLNNHNKAVPFQTDLKVCLELEEDVKELEAELHKLSEKQQEATQKLEENQFNQEKVNKERALVDKRIKEEEPIWEEVVQIDHHLAHAQQNHTEIKAELQQKEIDFKEQAEQLQKLETGVQKKNAELKELSNWLKKNAQDQSLLDGNLLIELHDFQTQWTQLSKEDKDKHSVLEKNTQKLNQIKSNLKSLKQELQKEEKEKEKLLKKQQQLVNDFLPQHQELEIEDMLHHLQEEIEDRALHYAGLKELAKLIQKRATVLNELDRISEEKTAAHIALENFDYFSLDINDQRNMLKSEIQYQQTLCENLKFNMSFEEHRQHLEEGSPCPLCMATEHPFRKQKNAVATETQLERENKKLEKLKNREAQLEERFENLRKDISEALTSVKHYDQQNQMQISAWDELQNETQQLYHNYPMLSEEYLDYDIEEMKDALRVSEQQHQNLIRIEKKLEDLKNKLAIKAPKIEGLKTQIQSLQKQEEEYRNEDELLQKEIAATKSNYQLLLKNVQATLNQINRPLEKLKQLEGLILELKKQKEDYSKKQAAAQELENSLSGLKAELKAAKSLFNKLEEDLQTIQSKEKESRTKLEALKEKRLNLFGDKNPKTEQQQLRAALKELEEQAQQLIKDRHLFQSELQTAKELISDKQKNKAQRALQLEKKQDILIKAAKNAGFQNFEELQAAILDKDKALALQKLKQKLDKELERVRELIINLESNLLAHEGQKPSDLSEEELIQLKEALASEEQALYQKIGQIQQILDVQASKLEKQKTLFKKINLQKKEVARWKELYDLIGHAEGKKFRQFAQNITLNKLIQLANKHLHQFVSGRYLLEKHAEDSLEIDIIDSFQANNKRPLSTLSGGETFLASLALALGLSDLASGRSQIESLFIDEGFGTLDQETLAIALKALQSLQAQGKTIGIISHVMQLKNNIDTQIQVHKKSSGFSEIKFKGH